MFRKMSEIELTIKDIRNVRMISVYELLGVREEPDKGCAAISVFYDKEGQINLCEMDEGFDILCDKVFEIYGEIRDDDSVLMDDHTRDILESGWQRKADEFLEKYYEATPVETPKVAFESTLSKRILPLVEYFLEAIYKIQGIQFEITSRKAGWRGSCIIYCRVNKQTVQYGLKILETSESRYEVKLVNYTTKVNEMSIDFMLLNDRILVDFYSAEFGVTGAGSIDFAMDGYSESYEAYREGKKIFTDTWFTKMNAPVLTEDELGLIPWKTQNNTMYTLPGGIVYLVSKDSYYRKSYEVNEYRSAFLFRKAEYLEARCWTRVSSKSTDVSLKTLSVAMQRMLLMRGQSQTYFVPHVGNKKHQYKRQLEGHFFAI